MPYPAKATGPWTVAIKCRTAEEVHVVLQEARCAAPRSMLRLVSAVSMRYSRSGTGCSYRTSCTTGFKPASEKLGGQKLNGGFGAALERAAAIEGIRREKGQVGA